MDAVGAMADVVVDFETLDTSGSPAVPEGEEKRMSVWRTCPVDGTRYFERSPDYPMGAEPGVRWCSSTCESVARAARLGREPRRGPRPYEPDVDGTLGASRERAAGGPDFVPMDEQNSIRLSRRREWVHLGEPLTAIPKGGRG